MSDNMIREIERHQHQVKSFQMEIDDAKRQIQSLKEHIARIKSRSNITSGEKSSLEIDKKRINDWKDKIERRKANIALEKESHKRALAYMKKQK